MDKFTKGILLLNLAGVVQKNELTLSPGLSQIRPITFERKVLDKDIHWSAYFWSSSSNPPS